MKTTVEPVTLGLGLVRAGNKMTPILVEMRLLMVTNTHTSKPWDLSWCCNKKQNVKTLKISGRVLFLFYEAGQVTTLRT